MGLKPELMHFDASDDYIKPMHHWWDRSHYATKNSLPLQKLPLAFFSANFILRKICHLVKKYRPHYSASPLYRPPFTNPGQFQCENQPQSQTISEEYIVKNTKLGRKNQPKIITTIVIMVYHLVAFLTFENQAFFENCMQWHAIKYI